MEIKYDTDQIDLDTIPFPENPSEDDPFYYGKNLFFFSEGEWQAVSAAFVADDKYAN